MQLTLILDNPSASYFAGQVVSGRCQVFSDNEIKTTGIKVNIHGSADVKWKESETYYTGSGSDRTSHTRTKTIRSSESYIDSKIYLLGSSGGEKFKIQPGNYTYPFSFQLPVSAPSSFKGKYGHIQYTLRATCKKSWAFDKHSSTTIFTVNGIVDLNRWAGAEVPSQFSKEKHLGCLWCKDGPIGFKYTQNRTGFVPGEGLDFVVEMSNLSSRPVNKITVKLKKEVVFRAQGKSRSESSTVVEYVGPGVGPGDTEIWEGARGGHQAKIPPIPPTGLGGCGIINVNYNIYVEMDIPSGFNLKGSTSVVIGTIPFRNTFQYMRGGSSVPEPGFHPGPSGDFPFGLPSAPPLTIDGYPDLPPPRYEDAFPYAPSAPDPNLPSYEDVANEDDDEKGNEKKGAVYDPNFVPKYATYGWSMASQPPPYN